MKNSNEKSGVCAQFKALLEETVLIILFQLYGSKAELFEDNLFWISPYDLHQPWHWKRS